MRKIATLLSVTLLLNMLAMTGFAFGDDETNDQNIVIDAQRTYDSEYDVTDDTLIFEEVTSTDENIDYFDVSDELEIEEIAQIEMSISTLSAGVSMPATIYVDNPHISAATIAASKASRTDGKYIGWSIGNMEKGRTGDGYFASLYTSWTCTCGFVQSGNKGHICDHIKSGNPSSAGGYGVWWETENNALSIVDVGGSTSSGVVYGPEVFSGLPTGNGVASPVGIKWGSTKFTGSTWGQIPTTAGETDMVVDPAAVPYITYAGERYYYYDEDGLIAPGNKTTGWVNLYLGGENLFEVIFETKNETDDIFAKTVVGAGLTVDRFADPTRSDMLFAGWYTEDGVPYDFDVIIEEDLVLIAKWEEKNYVDVYSPDGKFLQTVEVAVGCDIVLNDFDGNVFTTTKVTDDLEELTIDLVVDETRYVTGYEVKNDNGNIYITPIYANKTAVNIYDTEGEIFETVYLEPDQTLTQVDSKGEVVFEFESGDFQLVEDSKASGFELVIDEDGNYVVKPIIKSSAGSLTVVTPDISDDDAFNQPTVGTSGQADFDDEVVYTPVYKPVHVTVDGVIIETVMPEIGKDIVMNDNNGIELDRVTVDESLDFVELPKVDLEDQFVVSSWEKEFDGDGNIVYRPIITDVIMDEDTFDNMLDEELAENEDDALDADDLTDDTLENPRKPVDVLEDGVITGTIVPEIGKDIIITDGDGNEIGRVTIDEDTNSVVLPKLELESGFVVEGWYSEVDENGNTVYRPIISLEDTKQEADDELEEVLPENDFTDKSDGLDQDVENKGKEEIGQDSSKKPNEVPNVTVNNGVPMTNDQLTYVFWIVVLAITAYIDLKNRKKI